MKTNVKSPGFSAEPVQSELEVNYNARFFAHTSEANPDAYTRLILDVLQGKQAAFVRDDELRQAWKIFTPVLHKIENDNIRPVIYKQGGRGPKEADDFIFNVAGYVRSEDYVYYEDEASPKSAPPAIQPAPAEKTKTEEKGQDEADTGAVPEDQKCVIGLWGLAVMGQNFALNMASHGFRVCVGNRSPAKVDITVERAQKEGNLPLVGSKNAENFIAHLEKPRKVVILVQAGKPVDDTIQNLAKFM